MSIGQCVLPGRKMLTYISIPFLISNPANEIPVMMWTKSCVSSNLAWNVSGMGHPPPLWSPAGHCAKAAGEKLGFQNSSLVLMILQAWLRASPDWSRKNKFWIWDASPTCQSILTLWWGKSLSQSRSLWAVRHQLIKGVFCSFSSRQMICRWCGFCLLCS